MNSRTKGSSSNATSWLPLLKFLNPIFICPMIQPYTSILYAFMECLLGTPLYCRHCSGVLKCIRKVVFFFKETISESTSSTYMKWGMCKVFLAILGNEWFKKNEWFRF